MAGCFEDGNELLDFIKCWGILLLPGEMSASQEEFCGKELVIGQCNVYWTLKLKLNDILKMDYRKKRIIRNIKLSN